MEESHRRIRAFVRQHGISSQDCRVLSLGCGNGHLEIAMAQCVGVLLGIDISEKAVAIARQRAQAANLINLQFAVGDIQTLSFPRDSFDVIWAAAVLHHIDNEMIQRLLERSLQWLKPGGYFLSIDPSSRRLISLFKRLVQAKYQRYHSPDERELNPGTLCDMFRRAGFTNIRLLYPDYFLNPLSWLYPSLSTIVVRLVSLVDALLLKLPLVKDYASSFTVIAHRPSRRRSLR